MFYAEHIGIGAGIAEKPGFIDGKDEKEAAELDSIDHKLALEYLPTGMGGAYRAQLNLLFNE